MSWYNNNRRTTPAPSSSSTSTVGKASNDVSLSSPPTDSVSDLSWSPVAEHLAVASWDSKVRVYDLTTHSQGVGKCMIDFAAPVFSCSWSMDGQKIAGASADKSVRMLDLGGSTAQQVAAHDAPIRVVRFFELPNANAPMVVTGSWDKTVKYWDLRQSTPAATLECQDKIYSMDVKDQLLVIATADQHINVVNLSDPIKFFKTQQSPLKHQTRIISCFTNPSGWAVGSIEGRCGFEHVDPKHAEKNFTFRCHRSERKNGNIDVFSVNAMSFHPYYASTFTTAGSDGCFTFWDMDARSRIKSFESVGAPISATAFNKDGTKFAYAISYDWSKGYVYNTPQHVNKVMIHPTPDDEVRSKTTTRRR